MALSVLQRVEVARALFGYGQSAHHPCARTLAGGGAPRSSLSAASHVVRAQPLDRADAGILRCLGSQLTQGRVRNSRGVRDRSQIGRRLGLEPGDEAMEVVHTPEYAQNWVLVQVPNMGMMPNLDHYPTNGRVGHPIGMDAKVVLAVNLRTLLEYSLDHPGTGWPSSQKALAKVAKVGRGTVQRALDPTAPVLGIDILQRIAEPYKLEAWQLLVPGLDPTNPPVVPVTEAEKLLTERLKRVSRELATRLEKEAGGSQAGGARSDSEGSTPGPAHPKVPGTAVRKSKTDAQK